MRNLAAIGLLALASCAAQANCGTTISGESATLSVSIHDCEKAEMVIDISRFSPDVEGGVAEPAVTLASQCTLDKQGLRCRRGGNTVLAGSEYRYTWDTNPSCEGRHPGKRLTCTKGCTKSLPKYLYPKPYAC